MEKALQAHPEWSRAERLRPEAARRHGLTAGRPDRKTEDAEDAGADPEDGGMTDTTVGYLVRDVHRSLARALQSRIASHGVSMGQWFFLRALWDEDGLTQRELSQRVGMMEPTTVTALNGMERRNLVERVRNVHDRRKVNIYLTPKGRALREVLMPCSLEVNREATQGVSKTELAITMDVLRRMAGNLNGNSLLDEASETMEEDVHALS